MIKRLRVNKSAMMFLAVFLLLGCDGGGGMDDPNKQAKGGGQTKESPEPTYDNTLPGVEGIKNTIMGYNQAVMHGNMKQDYLYLVRKYAHEAEASRVVLFVAEDRSKGRVMRSTLPKLIFDNISTPLPAFDNISSDERTTSVYTTEHWEFDYLDLDTGNLKEPLKKITYKLRYQLFRRHSRWKIFLIEQLERPLVTEYAKSVPMN